MVSSPLARELAHHGPVGCIAAAAGRVWTCGGTGAYATFREWTQAGVLLSTCKLRSKGESAAVRCSAVR